VLNWWQQGNRNGLKLYGELKAQGYKGSPRAMYNYLATLPTPQSEEPKSTSSKPQKPRRVPPPPAPLENFSARRATWLFVCQPDELDETQQKELALIRAASPSAEAAYDLAQAFMQMIRDHTANQLENWLSLVEESALPEFKSFAKGIQQDKAAVLAGLTLPWSNGPVEGHVNRLKLIKRSMYGRAKLRLLRQRVLRSSPKKRRRPLTRVA
jgi:transposase